MFEAIWRYLKSAWQSFFALWSGAEKPSVPPDLTPKWTFRLCPTVSSSKEATLAPSVVALVGTADNLKWARLRCPCGCGEILALNLMAGHSPRWTVTTLREGTISIHPSVDATKCGAHFWIRDGRITWT